MSRAIPICKIEDLKNGRKILSEGYPLLKDCSFDFRVFMGLLMWGDECSEEEGWGFFVRFKEIDWVEFRRTCGIGDARTLNKKLEWFKNNSLFGKWDDENKVLYFYDFMSRDWYNIILEEPIGFDLIAQDEKMVRLFLYYYAGFNRYRGVNDSKGKLAQMVGWKNPRQKERDKIVEYTQWMEDYGLLKWENSFYYSNKGQRVDSIKLLAFDRKGDL